MQIAFDSSTLILLAKTGILDIFINEWSGSISVSRTVEQECLAKISTDAHLIQERVGAGKIIVREVRDKRLCAKLEKDFKINSGEAETLIMGMKFKSMVATDDWNAIQACKVMKLPFTSVLAILVRLKEKKRIDRVSSLAKLKELAEYGRYDDEIIKSVRRKLEE